MIVLRRENIAPYQLRTYEPRILWPIKVIDEEFQRTGSIHLHGRDDLVDDREEKNCDRVFSRQRNLDKLTHVDAPSSTINISLTQALLFCEVLSLRVTTLEMNISKERSIKDYYRKTRVMIRWKLPLIRSSAMMGLSESEVPEAWRNIMGFISKQCYLICSSVEWHN